MALDPNIALGVRNIELANPLAQYGMLAQIQNAQNQNALSQYQLGAAQRAEAKDIARTNMLAQAGTDDTAIANALLKAGDLPGYSQFIKTRREAQKSDVDLLDAKLKQSRNFLDTLDPADPSAPGKYIAWHEANHKDPIIGPALAARGVTAEQARASIMDAINKGPTAFANLVNQSKLGTEKFIELNKPVTVSQDLGPTGRILSRSGLSAGEFTVVPGSEYTKGKTFADLTAEQNARTNAGQLGLAQAKFAFEKANPGYELKEAEDGSFYGVNKRTLQAIPVTIGALAAAPAPAAAPGIGGPRAAMPTVAPAPAQAIPGMRSVLDGAVQTAAPVAPSAAPAAPAAGPQPFRGKGSPMTETQSNAAMFGGAMAQAQKTISELEKSGTVKNAVVPGLLTGLTRMLPYGSGEGMGNVIESAFNADPTGLIGPDASQQKLAQAQLAFSTAYLRKTSGASFGPSEVANTIKEFFPLIGDSEKVVAQKAAARERAIEGMKISTTQEGRKYIENYGAGGAAGGIPGATPNNPLALPIPGAR